MPKCLIIPRTSFEMAERSLNILFHVSGKIWPNRKKEILLKKLTMILIIYL